MLSIFSCTILIIVWVWISRMFIYIRRWFILIKLIYIGNMEDKSIVKLSPSEKEHRNKLEVSTIWITTLALTYCI